MKVMTQISSILNKVDLRSAVMRRRLVSCFTIVGFVTVMASASGASGNASPARVAKFQGAGVSFTYPTAWKAQHSGRWIGLRTDLIVGLSTQHLGSPCRWFGPRRLSVTCGTSEMLKVLHPGGVFVVWTRNWTIGGPAALPSIGSKAVIGGLPARVVRSRASGPCAPLEATSAITAYVSGGFEMNACARGLNSGRFEAQVESMLHSLAFRTNR